MENLNDERGHNDEKELFVYGFCSTQLYVDYREKIDQKLKSTMVELAKYYSEYSELDEDSVNEMLFDQYQKFWAKAEPSFQKFYGEIQEILAVPRDLLPKDLLPEVTFDASQTAKLEKEIKELKETYYIEKYFLHELLHRKKIVDSISKVLKETEEEALKMQKFEQLEILDQRRREKTEKLIGNFTKKDTLKFIESDIKVSQEKVDNFVKKAFEENT